jgi:hypothetical protein
VLTASADEWLAEITASGRSSPALLRAARFAPFFALLQELLADPFTVRARMLQAHTRGKTPPRTVRAQYARDLQWINAGEEGPLSFRWVCAGLGLEPSAVRRIYLSGQPVGSAKRRVKPSTLR